MSRILHSILNFNLDSHINHHLRHVPLERLPYPIPRFLGYRKTPQSDIPNLLIWTWAFVGAFTGLITVQALNKYAPGLKNKWDPPTVVASLGAGAILDYHAIAAPLAQPRNAFFGQLLSAVIGVAISKLFQLSAQSVDLQWIAGALACALASFVMGVTNTVHPPGGATALLAATNAQIIALGWMYIPFVMLGTSVMLAIALLLNNIQRQYPRYWWTPEELPSKEKTEDLERVDSRDSEQTLRHSGEDKVVKGTEDGTAGELQIVISGDRVVVPPALELSEEEKEVLAAIQSRITQAPQS